MFVDFNLIIIFSVIFAGNIDWKWLFIISTGSMYNLKVSNRILSNPLRYVIGSYLVQFLWFLKQMNSVVCRFFF